MAIECELARLFMKWKEVDLMIARPVVQSDRDSWEEEFRSWMAIRSRLDKICEFLTSQDFDSFILQDSKLALLVKQRHPESVSFSSFKQYFQERLFWKRNQIVHFGKIDFGVPEAEQCVHIAATLFKIMKDMDDVSIKRMDGNQRAAPKT
jgi:hypothetical protein